MADKFDDFENKLFGWISRLDTPLPKDRGFSVH